MSLGWLFCKKCNKYRKWPELYTEKNIKTNFPLECGHDSIKDVDIINHKEYTTDDAYERDYPDG